MGLAHLGTPVFVNISRKPQYKDIHRRTIEIPQRTLIFKVNSCLKAHIHVFSN